MDFMPSSQAFVRACRESEHIEMKRITLTEWAEAMFSRTPHINTLRSWARSGHIPGAVKVGRDWFVPAGVEYQPVPVSDRVREILGAR